MTMSTSYGTPNVMLNPDGGNASHTFIRNPKDLLPDLQPKLLR